MINREQLYGSSRGKNDADLKLNFCAQTLREPHDRSLLK